VVLAQVALAGLGIDVLEIRRMSSFIRNHSTRLNRVFSPAEITWASSSPKPAQSFGCLFAAKEAVFKSLGMSPAFFFRWRDIEIQAKEEPVRAVLRDSLQHSDLSKKQTIQVAWEIKKGYIFTAAIRKEIDEIPPRPQSGERAKRVEL